MVAFRSKTPGRLLLLVLVLSLLFVVLPSIVQAQADDTSEEDTSDPTPKPAPGPALEPPSPATTTTLPAITTNLAATTTTPAYNPLVTSPKHPTATSNSVPARGPPTTGLPNPIFSTSDACVACQKEYYTIQNCSSHLPPAGVNLTMIVQLLPFYGCMCQNNYVEIDALQQCSNCFRSTGQQAFLSPRFYNVTNLGVKSFKKVCAATANGSRVPKSAGGSAWDALKSSGSWMVISIMVVVLLPLGSL